MKNKGKTWTREEDEFLVKNIEKIGIEGVAKILKRTEDAVKNRMYKNNRVISRRRNKYLEGIPVEELSNYKLNLGSQYHFKSRTTKNKENLNEVLTCIANYKNYIRCRNKRGLTICILKADLLTNEIKIKKVG